MKKYLFHLMTALTIGAMIGLSACSEDSTDPNNQQEPPAQEVTPNFPSAVTKTLNAGESFTFEMTPNCDWTVSLPAEQMGWFWIQDGEHKVSSVRGAADEKATVVVATSEQEEFDNAPVCELSMTMNGETRVVATITRGTIEREFAVYPCKIEDETFAYATEGELDYAYESTAVSEIELLWPEGLNGYSFPVLFEANFNWHVVPATVPAWLTLSVSEGAAGEQVEVRFSGSNELEKCQAEVLFCDADNAEATYKLTVSMEDCKDRFSVSGFTSESRFSAAGEFGREGSDGSTTWMPAEIGASGYVTDIKDTKLFVLAENEEGAMTAEAATWINVALSAWDDAAGNLQTRELTLTVAVNEGAERKGVLYVLPAAEAPASAEALLTAEYDAYRVTNIRQSEAPAPPKTINVVHPEDMEGYATFIEMSEENNNNHEIVNGFGPYISRLYFAEGFVLQYNSLSSADYSALQGSKSYTYRYYDADYNEMQAESSWLTVMDLEENCFRIIMTPGLDPVDIGNWGMDIDNLGYVGLFDENGDPAVLIRCEYDEKEIEESGFMIEFAYPSQVSGAELTKISKDNIDALSELYPDMEDLFRENLAGNKTMYILEHTTATPTMALLKISDYYMTSLEQISSWVTLDASEGNDAVVIDMSGRSNKGDMTRIEFYDELFTTICFLYCVANF